MVGHALKERHPDLRAGSFADGVGWQDPLRAGDSRSSPARPD
jgi:hypothetical protein